MKRILLLLLSLYISCSLSASGIITGKVVTVDNDSTINYQVKLHTNTVRMKATFLKPDFILPTLQGFVTLTISAKGYKSYHIKLEMSYSTDIDLGQIILYKKK